MNMTTDGAHDPRDPAARDVVCYYHQPVKAPLLRDAILPLAERWSGAGLAVHVERHWLHGPHLRLSLAGPPDQVATAAATSAALLRRRLRDHPSRCDLTARELLDQAAEAGRAELIPPPYGPVRPDNTVRVEAADRSSLHRLLGPEGVALRDELLRLGLPALRAGAAFLGEHGDGAAARLQLAVTAMTAHAARFPAGLTAGYHSYLSHLEDFLVHDDPDGRLARAFDSRWQSVAEAVTALVGRVSEGRVTAAEREWAHWSAAAWQRAESRSRAGADLSASAEEYRRRAADTGDDATRRRWDARTRTTFSEYHRMMNLADPTGSMRTRPDLVVYRWCTNALYRLLAVCDVRPLERYLAAYLISRAVPVLTGHDWRREMADAIEAGRARGPVPAGETAPAGKPAPAGEPAETGVVR